MTPWKRFLLGSLVICIVINGLLIGAFYGAARHVLKHVRVGMEPALRSSPQEVPEGPRRVLLETNTYLGRVEVLSLPAVFGLGGMMTVVLWLMVQWPARRLLDERQGPEQPSQGFPEEAKLGREVERLKQELEATKRAASRPSAGPAVQILALLQRKGRLIDFLQEDLAPYEDSQIGAAVRSVHQGCKEVLSESVRLGAIFDQEEGEQVTVEPGFDPGTVRLIGEVKGDPPFKGILRHRGWRVARIDLPLKASGSEREWILAPAEVEIQG